MSDTMLLGCLRMPIELYPEGMSKESASFIVQQQSRCVEAADKIEQLQKENEESFRKGFWAGYEDARCFPDESNILQRYAALTEK